MGSLASTKGCPYERSDTRILGAVPGCRCAPGVSLPLPLPGQGQSQCLASGLPTHVLCRSPSQAVWTCRGLSWKPATRARQPLARPCPSSPVGWGGALERGGSSQVESKRQFNKATKEILILTMNMQNKLYAIQFSHHPMTNLQPVPKQ